MPETFEGRFNGKGRSIAIVVSRFNEYITQHLLDGAIKELKQHGVNEAQIGVSWVPGAFEIPLAVLQMADTGRYDGVIALGAIIRGETAHFEYLSQAVSKGLAEAQVKGGRPVAFGVITVDNLEQAIERAGSKHDNKGRQSARAVLEMIDLKQQLRNIQPVS